MKKTKKIYNFTAIFERNENNGYTITVPALPGLVSEGKNLEDARSMAEDAICCYIEGLKKTKEIIPIERDVAQMRLSVAV